MAEAKKKPKETDAIKKKLERYAGFQHLIENQIKRLEALADAMGSPSAPNLTGLPSGGDDSSKTERQVLRKIELEEKLAKMTQEEADERDELEALVAQIKKPDEQTIIELKYFDRLNWWEVTAILFGEKPDYDENEKRYLKRAFKIHGSALQSLAKIYNAAKAAK